MSPAAHRTGGLVLALGWLTVLPVRVRGTVDRTAGARALYWAPLVGLALGGIAAAALGAVRALGASPLLAGLLLVVVLAVSTRGMHLDGLADTADGLGCYGGSQRALEVMRDGSVGAFGVVTLVLVLGLQAGAAAALLGRGLGSAAAAVLLGVMAGRVAIGWCARRGVPAGRPEGLGALVAGTQPYPVVLAWTAVLTAAAVPVVPDRVWQGPVAVLAGAAAAAVLAARARRRFGGVTGDVLGAASELSTTAVLVGCAFGA